MKFEAIFLPFPKFCRRPKSEPLTNRPRWPTQPRRKRSLFPSARFLLEVRSPEAPIVESCRKVHPRGRYAVQARQTKPELGFVFSYLTTLSFKIPLSLYPESGFNLSPRNYPRMGCFLALGNVSGSGEYSANNQFLFDRTRFPTSKLFVYDVSQSTSRYEHSHVKLKSTFMGGLLSMSCPYQSVQ